MNEILKRAIDETIAGKVIKNANLAYEYAKSTVLEFQRKFPQVLIDYDQSIRYICESLRY